MNLSIQSTTNLSKAKNTIYLIDNGKPISKIPISKADQDIVKEQIKRNNNLSVFHSNGNRSIVVNIGVKSTNEEKLELARRLANSAFRILNKYGVKEYAFQSLVAKEDLNCAFLEGLSLSTYSFLKYKGNKTSKFKIITEKALISNTNLRNLLSTVEATFIARDLVNEPLSYLTATQYSKDLKKLGNKFGFKVTVFDKKRIQKEKMGGVIAVNLGSETPPTFNILEYKPAKPKNKQPIVLVGKGIVYDTGGLSLKPTANSMDMMKCDMAGSAAVTGTMCAISKMKLNVHVIGLIPATDNRPGKDAYVPGDVIKMHSGSTVEVLNTDAEGRLVLADALSYAKRYKPELVIDLATLTGASARAVGPIATAMMAAKADKEKNKLIESGFAVSERMVEFPLWDEYGEMISSDIADVKNIGGAFAGGITAGKFLQHFVDYPWIHLDIAGPAYSMKDDSYRGKYGSGVGVRLLVDFLKNR